MSTLPLVDTDTATGAAADLLAAVQRSLGVTPDMTKAMDNSPALLIAAARRSEAPNPKTAALPGFATAVNDTRGAITADDVDAVRSAGTRDPAAEHDHTLPLQ